MKPFQSDTCRDQIQIARLLNQRVHVHAVLAINKLYIEYIQKEKERARERERDKQMKQRQITDTI